MENLGCARIHASALTGGKHDGYMAIHRVTGDRCRPPGRPAPAECRLWKGGLPEESSTIESMLSISNPMCQAPHKLIRRSTSVFWPAISKDDVRQNIAIFDYCEKELRFDGRGSRSQMFNKLEHALWTCYYSGVRSVASLHSFLKRQGRVSHDFVLHLLRRSCLIFHHLPAEILCGIKPAHAGLRSTHHRDD